MTKLVPLIALVVAACGTSSPKQEPAKQEPAKQEPAKQEPVKQEPAQQQAAPQQPAAVNSSVGASLKFAPEYTRNTKASGKAAGEYGK